MEITGYIAALLFTEEVVVLPGFGAFKVNYKSSVVKDISDEMAAILPPVKEVSFSSEMKEGAGLLAAYISKVENLSIQDAETKLAEYTKQISARLEAGEIVNFEGIGTLYYTKDKRVEFVSEAGANFNAESMGMGAIQVENTEAMSREQVVDNSKKSFFARINWLRASIYTVAVLLIVALGVYFYYTNLHVTAYKKAMAMVDNFSNEEAVVFDTANNVEKIEQPSVDSISDTELSDERKKQIFSRERQKADSVANLISSEEPKKEAGRNQKTTTELNKKVTSNKTVGRFHIIAGSFSTYDNAVLLKNDLLKEGFSGAQVLPLDKKMYRVAVESLSTKEEATIALERVKSKPNRSTAWLLEL